MNYHIIDTGKRPSKDYVYKELDLGLEEEKGIIECNGEQVLILLPILKKLMTEEEFKKVTVHSKGDNKKVFDGSTDFYVV